MIIRNFLFHRVTEETDNRWPPMSPGLFSQTIEFLTKRYHVVGLEHFLEDPTGYSGGKPLATISFDDGYKDNIEYAAPILKQFNCPASFYIVTDSIDRNVPTWTYLVDHAFGNTRKKEVELDFDFVPGSFKRITLNGSPLHMKVKPWMKSLPNAKRLLVTDSILKQCDDVGVPAGKMMNWNEVRALQGAGFIVGSHSHTHPMLGALQETAEIESELRISAARIQEETGQFPLTISYPIGSFDERVMQIAKATGYAYGLAVEQKYFEYPGNTMAIPRVELYQQPWWKVQLHLTGNYWNRLRRLAK